MHVIIIDAASCLAQSLVIQDWLVFEWLETIITCLLGLHDAKLGINLDDDGADSDQPEDPVTVANPMSPKEPEAKDEGEKKKKGDKE